MQLWTDYPLVYLGDSIDSSTSGIEQTTGVDFGSAADPQLFPGSDASTEQAGQLNKLDIDGARYRNYRLMKFIRSNTEIALLAQAHVNPHTVMQILQE